MRKLIGQLPNSPAPDQIHFNLERGKRTKLQGMIVDAMMAAKKVVGPGWHNRPENEKDEIVRMLIDNEREDAAAAVAGRLIDEFGFAANGADEALGLDFPAGYVSLSLVAIDKLLPHLEKGLVLQSDTDPERYERICQHAASLMRKGQLPYAKYRRFLQKELDLDDFVARQLTDTGYIARATAEYLRCLFDEPHRVLGLKG